MNNSTTYSIDTKFVRASGKQKSRKIETIVDIFTTRNSAGDIVKLQYVATHEVMGQLVTDYDIPLATIARAIKV